jgi:O-antigen/teichoic acid export membrane protein
MKFLSPKYSPSAFVKNISWNILASTSTKLIKPLFSILVARILVPQDYGVLAIAIAIQAFFITIKDLGVTSVIIVKNDGYDYTKAHFSIQFVTAIVNYLLILISRGWIADYFGQPILTTIMPILGLGLFISSVEDALLTRHFKKNEYKIVFYRQLIPTIVSGVAALTLAMLGFGVYSLILSMLLGSLASTIFLVIFNKWIPTFEFDLKRLKSLFSLGIHVATQRISGFIALQLDSLIVAKNIGAHGTGLYRMSMDLSTFIPNTFLFQYQQVLFTEAVSRPDDSQYISHRYNQFIKSVFAFTFINFVAVYLLAPSLIPLILGEKWVGLVQPVQLIAISIISSNLVNPNVQFSQIFGFNHIYTYFALIRSSVTAFAILLASFHSLHAVLLAWVAIGVIGNFVNFAIFKAHQDEIAVTRSIYFMFMIVTTLYMIICVDWIVKGIV